MNSTDPRGSRLDLATVNSIGWISVFIFAISLSIFIYRLQQSLNTDLGGLKSVRII